MTVHFSVLNDIKLNYMTTAVTYNVLLLVTCWYSNSMRASLISYRYDAAEPVTVAGRLAEVPPTAYPTQMAVARVRLGGGNCMKQGPDDRHAVA